MFNDLSSDDKALLEEQQKTIINSKEKYVVVSASPGCGKTYTLVKKIEKTLGEQSTSFGIIACSFTREASEQIKRKISKSLDLSMSFVGTIDSFVLSEIISPYKNRLIYEIYSKKSKISKLKVTIPDYHSLSSKITKIGKSHSNVHSYFKKWLEYFLNGRYENSYCAYLLACKMIKEMPEVRSFISARYSCIFVDEAQDLNEFQHDFINCLKQDCGLSIFLIGDKNQSIYEFRGAKPKLFASLPDNGYKEYKITVSVRCDKSIICFANNFLNGSYTNCSSVNSNVKVLDPYSVDKLIDAVKEDKEILWLFETKKKAVDAYEFSESKKLGFVYSTPIEITSDKEFGGTYLQLIEEILLFYFNYRNPIAKFSYPGETFDNVLMDYATEAKVHLAKNIIRKTQVNLSEYLTKIFSSIDIAIPSSVIQEITSQIENPTCLNHYKRNENKKRIMTIHSSKGLQAETVVVGISYSDYFYNTNPDDIEPNLRKYFVAFSRAEKLLYLFFCSKNDNGEKIQQENIKKKILESI